jgi:putative transcriptional regulator
MPNFEWEPDKAARNLKRHKVTFEAARGVFDDPFALDEIDDRENYGEERSNVLGIVAGRLLVVTYTLRTGPPASSPHDQRSRMKDADIMKRSAKRTTIDWTELDALSDEEIHKAALSDPDARPLTRRQLARMKRIAPVKRLRVELGLSQAEFAERFHIPIGTLRDWEQRRSEPDQAAQAYLKVIAADAQFVERALAAA